MSINAMNSAIFTVAQRARPWRTRRAAMLGWCAALIAAVGAATLAHAQSYPTRTVRLVVPYNAGGATDNIARMLAERLGARMGQTVIVENKGGAGGIIGTDAVAKAPPDGYTLAVTLSASLLTNQFLYEKLPYNAQRDLALVTRIANAPIVLVVHPSVPANNAAELMQYISNNKKRVSYGSWGIGSYPHLAGAHMSLVQQADMSHIAYKGEAPMLQDLIGGQIQFAYASVPSAKAHIEAGKLKLIGVTGTKRLAVLPNAPTLLEQGLKDEVYSIVGFIGVAAPANTPKAIVQQIAREIQAVCETKDVAERITAMGFSVVADSPDEFATSYKRELPVWERLVKQSGAKLE